MRYLVLAGALVVGACSSGPETDLPAIRSIRSAAAEWALVNQEAGRGRLTDSYVAGMREAAREEIAKEARGLSPLNALAARQASALQALPDAAPADVIRAHVSILEQIETVLESA